MALRLEIEISVNSLRTTQSKPEGFWEELLALNVDSVLVAARQRSKLGLVEQTRPSLLSPSE